MPELIVSMQSDEFGYEEFGPYDSDEEMFEVAKRLVASAKEHGAGDGVTRTISIEVYCGAVCECGEREGIESTPCGSFCAECFKEHCEECKVCKSESAKWPIF